MRNDFNLNSHIISSKSRDTNSRPNRFMIRHPLLEIPRHCSQSFIVYRNVIGVDTVDLGPPLPACIFQAGVDIDECLVDLRVDFGVELEDAVFLPAS